MKICVVLATAIIFSCAGMDINKLGQTPPEKIKEPFSYIIETKLPKDKNYEKSMVWAIRTFSNIKNGLQMQDKESGIIIGKATGLSKVPTIQVDGTLSTTNTWNCEYDYLIKIDLRDNKARIVFSDFFMKTYGMEYLAIYNSVKRDMDSLANSYKSELLSQTDQF